MQPQVPIQELPPDPRLKGWPQPIGWGGFAALAASYRGPSWVAIGDNCYKKRKLKAVFG